VISEGRALSGWETLWLPALVLIVAIAYQPAWHGGMLWDDDGHVTRSGLRSLNGLWRTWFDVGATQQYYPVVHSLFWLQARLWGENTLGYHFVNIGLHALSGFLLIVLLRRLRVPGAALAGLLFALHPVQVETVAWITELKNTLSGALYLASALAYLRFDDTRGRRFYAAALALFVLALLSKTVTATLPAALLVVLWWKRGSLSWRRDAAPLIPFFALGGAAGLMTSWIETVFIGAQGTAFDLTPVERVLVAGRAIAFYFSKLLWPAGLTFFYPRWVVREDIWWQYLFPMGVAAVLAVLWRLRVWSRAPLAAAMYFCITLAPALGFVNVFPFKYSFVADHFQYLASIGIFALAAAGLVQGARRWKALPPPAVQAAMMLVLGGVLGVLTWRQSRQYVSAERLYLETIARNPSSWLAQNNLAELKRDGSEADRQESFARLQEALRLAPDEPIVLNNIGVSLRERGRLDEALVQHQKAIQAAPRYAEAYGNVGRDLFGLGRFKDAVGAYREALRIKPDLATIVRGDLGLSLEKSGMHEEAIVELRRALQIDPGDTPSRLLLADTLLRQGQMDEAIQQYREALRLSPTAQIHNSLGYALGRTGHFEEAASELREAIRLDPTSAAAHDNLGNVLQGLQQAEQAVAEYKEALRLPSGGNLAAIHSDLGVAFATLGRRDEAIQQFRAAVALDSGNSAAQANLARASAGK
jgi:tetratricopeptide (TPR) repeat protein